MGPLLFDLRSEIRLGRAARPGARCSRTWGEVGRAAIVDSTAGRARECRRATFRGVLRSRGSVCGSSNTLHSSSSLAFLLLLIDR